MTGRSFMLASVGLLSLSALGGCDEEPVGDQPSVAISDIGVDGAAVGNPQSVADLTSEQTALVCKKGIAEIFAQPVKIMQAKEMGDIVRVSYHRPSDGKLWKNDCRLEGNRVLWRAVDISPGSGPGRWRDSPEDEVITYAINGNDITVSETF